MPTAGVPTAGDEAGAPGPGAGGAVPGAWAPPDEAAAAAAAPRRADSAAALVGGFVRAQDVAEEGLRGAVGFEPGAESHGESPDRSPEKGPAAAAGPGARYLPAEEGAGDGPASAHAWLQTAKGYFILKKLFNTRASPLQTADLAQFDRREAYRGVPEGDAVKMLRALTRLEDHALYDVVDFFDPLQKGGVCFEEYFLLFSALAARTVKHRLEFLYQHGAAAFRLVRTVPRERQWHAMCTLATLLHVDPVVLRKHCIDRGVDLKDELPNLERIEEIYYLALTAGVEDRLAYLLAPPAEAERAEDPGAAGGGGGADGGGGCSVM